MAAEGDAALRATPPLAKGGGTAAEASGVEPDAAGLVKVSLNLPIEVYEQVAAEAAARRVTKTEVMRRALTVHLFLAGVRAEEGGKLDLFVRRPSQATLQQVVFPWFI
jgi:hypothetical protein